MFKDYYEILGISFGTSIKEIQTAYRELVLKWHPDRNPGKYTGDIIKDIIEAYSILKDETKRKKYDNEYLKFKSHKSEFFKESKNQDKYNSKAKSNSYDKDYNHYYYEYDVEDETLNNDIYEARRKAENFIKEFYEDLKADSKRAANGAWKAIKPFLILFAFTLGVMIISLIIAAISGKQ